MQFTPWKKQPQSSSSSSTSNPTTKSHQTQHTLLLNLQTHFSNFLQNLSNPFQQQHNFPFQSALQNLAHHAHHTLAGLTSGAFPGGKRRTWARVSARNDDSGEPFHRFDLAMSIESIEERLAGVPVYALSNSAEEFVLISGVSTGKSLGLFCFKKEDADSLLAQMKSMDPDMRRGSKVVPVALNKAIQLKLNGVAFRIIPDSSQIQNALKVKKQAGLSDEGFSGVPVFQSQSLFLKSENKRYRPFFFRKEDLENSLMRASQQQRQLNPAFRQGDIQVAVFEEIIKGMKESLASNWDDVVFIPPGFDVSTAFPQQKQLTASG